MPRSTLADIRLDNIYPKVNTFAYVGIGVVLSFLQWKIFNGNLDLHPRALWIVFLIDFKWFIYPILKLSYRMKSDDIVYTLGGIFGLFWILYALVTSGMVWISMVVKRMTTQSFQQTPAKIEEVLQMQELLLRLEPNILIWLCISQLALTFFVFMGLRKYIQEIQTNFTMNPVLMFFGFQFGYPKYVIEEIDKDVDVDMSLPEDFGFIRMVGYLIRGGWSAFIITWGINAMCSSN